ncbi:MAG TPA: hypothetical protein VNM48_09090 [Chloroflexota bacterium]|nr:hypothetical protein [Chloroflexota bacterium]
MDTRTNRRPVRDPEDDAADRRIEAWYWSLPSSAREAVDAQIGWHLLMGGGRSAETLLETLLQARFDDALRQAAAQVVVA